MVSALAGAARPVGAPAQETGTPVQVQMRHTDFHVDSSIVMRIDFLRGELRPTKAGHAPYFDDKQSFLLNIDSAHIAIAPSQLGTLLNRYTFAYPGAPLRRLRVSVEKGQIRQRGTMRGISFNILADVTLTKEGELRLRPTSGEGGRDRRGRADEVLRAASGQAGKASRCAGRADREDDFYLNPPELLPPPLAKGKVGGVEVTDSAMVLTFQPQDSGAVKLLKVPEVKSENCMFYRGGVLRFGKLTRHETDLMIVDAEPKDPFDFFLDHYNAQLVAGYSRNIKDHGLIVTMPDYRRTLAPDRGRLHPHS